MANLTDKEKDELMDIECIGNTESDINKALLFMAFIYTPILYLALRG